MIMKRYALIVVLGLASFLARGQAETEVIINYMPALSMGETAEFTKNFSPRGIELEVNNFLAEGLSVGISAGWNVFREKVVGESIEYRDALVTGTQFRYTNVVPLNVNARKYFPVNDLFPFVGMGIGTSYAKQTNNIGIFSIVSDKWLFTIAPEAGIQVRVGPAIPVSLKIKYSYSVKAGDFPSMSYLGFGVGIGLL
jgi:opacity protein-like surface antigen